MARTAASAELWSTSIGKSGWRALAASWLGWMLCCSDYRLETLHSYGEFALFPGSTHVKASTSRSLAFCLLVILTSFDLFAQSASTGALTGTVFDPAGAVVSNATIILRNNGTRQTFTDVTNPSGIYRFALLPPGQYERNDLWKFRKEYS